MRPMKLPLQRTSSAICLPSNLTNKKIDTDKKKKYSRWFQRKISEKFGKIQNKLLFFCFCPSTLQYKEQTRKILVVTFYKQKNIDWIWWK